MTGRKRTISRVYTTSTQPVPSASSKRSRPSKRSTTKKNSKLLSGHTNSDNKKLFFVYPQQTMAASYVTPYKSTWRANGPYDPDVAIGGASAYGFAAMAARFDKHYVKSATFRLVVANYNNTAMCPLVLVWADNKETIDVSLNSLQIAVGVCRSNGGIVQQLPHILSTPGKIKPLTVYTKDVYRGGMSDEDNQATMDNTPTNQVYFHFMIHTSGVAITSEHSMNAIVEIEYDTVFFDPKDLV